MIRKHRSRLACRTTSVGARLSLALALAACGNDSGSEGSGNSDSGAASGDSDGGAHGGGSCEENALFPARSFGDDQDDLIRAVRVDETTHDVYFRDMFDIYRV